MNWTKVSPPSPRRSMLCNLYEITVNSFLDFRLFDAIDIFLTTLLIYWFLTIIKGTRAIYMLIGLAIGLVMVWVTSLQAIEMISLNWLLTNFFRHLPLIVIVLFQ